MTPALEELVGWLEAEAQFAAALDSSASGRRLALVAQAIRSLSADKARLEEALTQISTGVVLAATDRDEWIEYVTNLARAALALNGGGADHEP